MNSQLQTYQAVVSMVLAMLSITAGAAIAKSLYKTLDPGLITCIRLAISSVILLFVFRVWTEFRRLNGKWALFAYGMSVLGMNLFFYLSIQLIPIGVALALELTGPLCVAAIYSKSTRDFLWLGLAAFGVFLLAPATASSGDLSALGIVFALVAGVFWGGYIVFGRYAGTSISSKSPAYGTLIASVLIMPYYSSAVLTVDWSATLVLLAVVMALLSSAIPLTLEMYSLKHLPTNTYGILTSGEPVIGALMGLIILGEILSAFQWAGISAIVFAAVGNVITRRPHMSEYAKPSH